LEQAIDFPDSIVGQTIKNNAHAVVDDLESSTALRYFQGEKSARNGSFISVPISSVNKCYGALNVESKDKYNFSRQDIEMLYRLAENAAFALEILYLQEAINEYVIIDPLTGVYSKKFFLQRLEEELHRADDHALELSFLFLSLDKTGEIGERFDQEGTDRVIATLAQAIRASIRPYDIAGRYATDRFGVVLANTASSDAYLWAEKIRKNIAGHVINSDGKSFSVTVSIGVCGALEEMKKEELLGNTAAVLNKATESGGNAVRIF
jgi:diguanylate cyclase (GGDEF)-like protein